MTANPYDEVPYPSGAFPQTHPDRMATLASLFGMSPPALERCRVLELGCSSGGNLVPMAFELPRASFLGIDYSAAEIGEGQRLLAGLGLDNVELRQHDILGFEPAPGGFDYVICHGLYSWVAGEVRERILAICDRALSPLGVAYVSYNTYPGNYFRNLLRDMMRWQTAELADPRERVVRARSLATFLAGAAPATNPMYAAILKGESERLAKLSDEVLLHDDLETTNQPVYFHQFIEHAAAHHLQYLAEARFADMQAPPLPAGTREALARSGDLVTCEQFHDFLRCRSFRQTLLCREAVPLERQIAPGAVESYRIRSRVRSANRHPDLLAGEPDRFTNGEGVTMGLTDPLHKAALGCLFDAAPQALSFDDLLDQALARLRAAGAASGARYPQPDRDSLADLLLEAYRGDMVALHLHVPRIVALPGERPEASRCARLQSAHGIRLTNLWHENLELDEPFALQVLREADGSRDHKALLARLTELVLTGALPFEPAGEDPAGSSGRLAQAMDLALAKMARLALLSA